MGQIDLIERKSKKVAWRGELRVEGQGQGNITDAVFIDSTSSAQAELVGVSDQATGIVHGRR